VKQVWPIQSFGKQRLVKQKVDYQKIKENNWTSMGKIYDINGKLIGH